MEMLVYLVDLEWKVYKAKVVCRTSFDYDFIWYDDGILVLFLLIGGRTLPGIRGDAGRDGLPGRQGAR